MMTDAYGAQPFISTWCKDSLDVVGGYGRVAHLWKTCFRPSLQAPQSYADPFVSEAEHIQRHLFAGL